MMENLQVAFLYAYFSDSPYKYSWLVLYFFFFLSIFIDFSTVISLYMEESQVKQSWVNIYFYLFYYYF